MWQCTVLEAEMEPQRWASEVELGCLRRSGWDWGPRWSQRNGRAKGLERQSIVDGSKVHGAGRVTSDQGKAGGMREPGVVMKLAEFGRGSRIGKPSGIIRRHCAGRDQRGIRGMRETGNYPLPNQNNFQRPGTYTAVRVWMGFPSMHLYIFIECYLTHYK